MVKMDIMEQTQLDIVIYQKISKEMENTVTHLFKRIHVAEAVVEEDMEEEEVIRNIKAVEVEEDMEATEDLLVVVVVEVEVVDMEEMVVIMVVEGDMEKYQKEIEEGEDTIVQLVVKMRLLRKIKEVVEVSEFGITGRLSQVLVLERQLMQMLQQNLVFVLYNIILKGLI